MAEETPGGLIQIHKMLLIDPSSVFVLAEVAQEGEVCSCGGRRAVDKLRRRPDRQRNLKHKLSPANCWSENTSGAKLAPKQLKKLEI